MKEVLPKHTHFEGNIMKHVLRTTCLAALAATAMSMQAMADDKLSVDVSLNHDAFFGTNPFLGATYDAEGDLDYTFYGIQWGDGTGGAWGQWTEFGFGVGFEALGGDLYVNPQIGFTMGNLLSSGTANEGVVGDGIVPNITMLYDTDAYEGQLYAGYYHELQDRAPEGGSTLRYIHYWVNGGKKFGDYFSAGLHFEELRLSGGSDVESQDGYRWLGPYFQVAKGNAGLRFSFGADLTDDEESFSQSDFYKLQFFFSF